MQITIINRKETNAPNKTFTVNNLKIHELLLALWNVPEKRSLFTKGLHYNAIPTDTQLNAVIATGSILKIHHRRLGIILENHPTNPNMTIDESSYFKHREYDANFLEQTIMAHSTIETIPISPKNTLRPETELNAAHPYSSFKLETTKQNAEKPGSVKNNTSFMFLSIGLGVALGLVLMAAGVSCTAALLCAALASLAPLAVPTRCCAQIKSTPKSPTTPPPLLITPNSSPSLSTRGITVSTPPSPPRGKRSVSFMSPSAPRPKPTSP